MISREGLSKKQQHRQSVPFALYQYTWPAGVPWYLSVLQIKSIVVFEQVSWLAARAITHRFIRLYFEDMPEKYQPNMPNNRFPTPLQVFNTSHASLRSAGLSGRKAEYIVDLASRFADGRLSAEKLIRMSGECRKHLSLHLFAS